MPDMPIPPMPTKWIVPMSVPNAFIMKASHKWHAFIMRARPRPAPRVACEHGADRDRRKPVADPLDQIGEVARGVRPADRQRARGGIVERDRVGRHRLDLAREHVAA